MGASVPPWETTVPNGVKLPGSSEVERAPTRVPFLLKYRWLTPFTPTAMSPSMTSYPGSKKTWGADTVVKSLV